MKLQRMPINILDFMCSQLISAFFFKQHLVWPRLALNSSVFYLQKYVLVSTPEPQPLPCPVPPLTCIQLQNPAVSIFSNVPFMLTCPVQMNYKEMCCFVFKSPIMSRKLMGNEKKSIDLNRFDRRLDQCNCPSTGYCEKWQGFGMKDISG